MRIGDGEANGDYSHLWHVVARGGRREHTSTAAVSGPLRIVLSNQGRLNEGTIASGLVRIYRRNIDEILAQATPVVVATAKHLELFVGSRDDEPLERVLREVEDLAFALGQLPSVLAAASSGAQMELPLPAPAEWPAVEPILRVQSSHSLLSEFFQKYVALAATRFYASDAEPVAAAARHCSMLAAVAIHAVDPAKVEGLMFNRSH